MKNYKIGLSLKGIIMVALIMLPNVIYLFYTPPNDVLSSNEASFWFWNILENVGRFGLMITLCFIINKNTPTISSVGGIVAACSVIAYYALWITYFAGIFNELSLVGMAFFPSVFFLLIARWQRNAVAFIFAALFAIMHISITISNYLLH